MRSITVRTVFWVLTPCSSETTRRFGEKYQPQSSESKSKPSKKPDQLSICLRWFYVCLVYPSTVKMVTIYSSETSGSLRTTRRYNLDYRTPHGHRRKNLKSNNRYPRNFPAFNETETFRVCSEKPIAGLYPKLDESCSHSVLLSSYSGTQNRETYSLHVYSSLLSYGTLTLL
jgi:hypothetical protein